MPGYVISCCSTADLTKEWLEGRDIKFVYFNYQLDGVSCKDDFGVTNPPAQLYAKMLSGQDCKTSQVATGDYVGLWRPFLERGLDVLHVTLSSGISGTYNSACAARDVLAAEFPDRKIHVIDSLAASSGYGLLMDRLADKRDEGLTIDELRDWCERHKLEVHHWYFSSDLTFFVRGGRISKVAGHFGGLLHICPVMNMPPDGSLAVVEKIRTKKRAIRRVVDLMHETAQDGDDYSDRVFISMSECPDDAQAVADLIRAEFPRVRDIHIFDIGATIGVHTGPGTVATFWWGSPRT